MPSQKSIPISELITTANSELLRLDFKRSALQIYCAEFRKFSDYYSNEKIQDYTATTGREYFQSIYGVNIASPRLQLTKSQSATRRAIRLLDDIFQFGYALRYCHRSYTVNPEYDILLESYLMKCRKKHNSQGTLRTKQMKLCQFFEYLRNGRLDSNCDNVFIRHLHPYGGFQSSAAVSSALKKYITYAGLTRKNRKAIHSLRRTLASTLLMDGTPLLTISNILGHSSPKTTTGYTKVNLPALRKCALSYGKWEASA